MTATTRTCGALGPIALGCLLTLTIYLVPAAAGASAAPTRAGSPVAQEIPATGGEPAKSVPRTDARSISVDAVPVGEGVPVAPPGLLDLASDSRSRCGRITCTTYFNRRETKQMRNRTGAMGVLAPLCKYTVFIPCAVTVGVYALWNSMASNAYAEGRCLKIKWPTLEPGSYKSSGGTRCR